MREAGRTRTPGARGAAGPGEAPRVLMLSAAHPPTDLRIVGKEGAALAAAGWAVTHLAPAPPGGTRGVPWAQDGVAIATYPRPEGWIGRLRAARALARRAARLRPDVIHAHEPDSWHAALLAARRCGARVVLDVHEHYPSRLDGRLPRGLRWLGRRAVRAACRRMGARADAVVVAKDGLEDAYPGARIVPVRNYAAAAAVVPRAHGPGPVTLVHLGALTRARGSLEMLRALALLPPDTRLSLVGRFTDGSEAGFLAEAARLGVADRVERHGWRPHAEALAIAAGADIGLVLFQPGHENHRLALPHKLFDCMLAGLPVVAPDFAEEVAGVVRGAGCGVLADTSGPEAVAAAVRGLLDPARRAALGAAGREAALGRFGWAGEAERLVGLYRRLAPLPAAPVGPAGDFGAADAGAGGPRDAGSAAGAGARPAGDAGAGAAARPAAGGPAFSLLDSLRGRAGAPAAAVAGPGASAPPLPGVALPGAPLPGAASGDAARPGWRLLSAVSAAPGRAGPPAAGG